MKSLLFWVFGVSPPQPCLVLGKCPLPAPAAATGPMQEALGCLCSCPVEGEQVGMRFCCLRGAGFRALAPNVKWGAAVGSPGDAVGRCQCLPWDCYCPLEQDGPMAAPGDPRRVSWEELSLGKLLSAFSFREKQEAVDERKWSGLAPVERLLSLPGSEGPAQRRLL